MPQPNPRVTIGIPVYNGAKYLADALESILRQTYQDFEVVISDNASVDATQEICRDYVQRDRRIRCFRQSKNQGAIWNFNHTVTLARGEYFKWTASDDVCEPTYLERCVQVLDREPDAAWCHSQSGKIDANGHKVLEGEELAEGLHHSLVAGLPRKDFDSPKPHRRFEGVLLGPNWCPDSYGLLRLKDLLRTGLLPICYGPEKVLLAELSLMGQYREVPETLFHQRIHADASGNLSSAAAQQNFTNPRASKRFAMTRVKLLAGYTRAVVRSPVSTTERFRCGLAIVRYLFQARKWGRIVRNTLTGADLGDRKLFRKSLGAR